MSRNLRGDLCLVADVVADLAGLAGCGSRHAWLIRAAVADTALRGLRGLCREVMRDAPDEELCRTGEGLPYLRRWWLRRGPADQPSSEAVYLHETLAADEPPPHNHPWPSAALLVNGALEDEEQVDDPAPGGDPVRRWPLRPGDVLYRPASHCHLLDPHGSHPLTVFATGVRVQAWGFRRPDGTFGRDRRHALRGRRAHLASAQT